MFSLSAKHNFTVDCYTNLNCVCSVIPSMHCQVRHCSGIMFIFYYLKTEPLTLLYFHNTIIFMKRVQ